MGNLIHRFAGAFQLVFVVAVVGFALLLSATLKPDASAGPPARVSAEVPVSVVVPEPVAFRPVLDVNGVVEARTVTDLVPQVGGRIVEVSPAFRPGSFVREGQLLFRIDPTDYELAIERTAAEIEGARSDLALLQAQAAAEKQVWDKQFPDRKIPDLIARVPQIAATEARIRSGEAARAAAKLDLERTIVRAPYDARVLETRLDVGQVVNPAAAVGSIFSVDSLEIAVPVSTEELARIGNIEGRTVTVSADRLGDAVITGSLARASASLDERTRLATLYVATARSASLMLGEFVDVRIDGPVTTDALRVPAAALTSRDQLWVVDAGVLQARRVEILGSEADHAIVRTFDRGDGVVAVPPSNVRDGLPVKAAMQKRFASAGGSASGGQ